MLFANRRAPLITSGLHFEDIPISPVLLGVVEELVSPLHKIFQCLPSCVCGNAATDRHFDRCTVKFQNQPLDFLPYPFGQREGRSDIGGKEDQKFLATEANRNIRSPALAPNDCSNLAKNEVSVFVTIRVIDPLEVINIEGHPQDVMDYIGIARALAK